MALERRRVEKDHLRALFRLKVAEDQAGLVAPNEITLAQAAYEPGGYVWGLWEGDIAVGLLAMIHPHEAGGMEEGEDPDAAYLWRLMIGGGASGQGMWPCRAGPGHRAGPRLGPAAHCPVGGAGR